MKLLRWLANIFINTFGITQPSPEQEDRMAIFIAILLAAVLVGIAAVTLLLRNAIHG